MICDDHDFGGWTDWHVETPMVAHLGDSLFEYRERICSQCGEPQQESRHIAESGSQSNPPEIITQNSTISNQEVTRNG